CGMATLLGPDRPRKTMARPTSALCAILFFFLSFSAWGQNATTIQVLAPAVRLTAGDTMTLTAFPMTSTGATTTQTVNWRVDNPSIATIDSTGKLTGVSLGIVRITAFIGNLTHDTMVQITPDRVSITPDSAQLMIGENQQFRATAFDKQGKAIPNLN